MTLTQKISFTLLIILIFAMIFIWYFVIVPSDTLLSHIENDYRHMLKSEFKTYLQQAETAISSSDKNSLDALVNEIKNIPRISSVSIFNSDGIILSSSAVNFKGKKIDDATKKAVISAIKEPVLRYADMHHGNTIIFIYCIPNSDNKSCAGGIEISITAANLNQLRSINHYKIPLSVLIAFLALIVLNFIMIKLQIINRLDGFKNQIKNLIERKNLSTKLPITGNDEITACAHSANQLIGTLEQVIRQAASNVDQTRNKNKLLKESSCLMNQKIREQGAKTDEVFSAIQGFSSSLQAVTENITELGNSSEGASAFIFQMQAAIEEIVASIEKLSSFVETNSDNLDQVTSSISSVSSSIDELSSAVTEIVASTSQMDYAIKQVDTSTKEAAFLSTNTMKSAETGSEYVSQTINSISSIKSSVEETSRSIDLLIEKTEAISKVLTVIKDITEQTNLLSLNASILAAQAGEYGRSFGVVATEIKNLADKTASSTKEIKSLINQIQLFSQNTRQAMDASVETISSGIQISSKAGHSLKEILNNIKNVVAIVQRISNATTEQSRGSKQITEAMEKVADMTLNISNATQELNRVSQEIAASINEVKLLSNQIKTNASDQVKGSKEALVTIEKMASLVNAVNEGCARQSDNIARVNTLITDILELSKLFMINSQTIQKTIADSEAEQDALSQSIEGFIAIK